MKTASDMKVLGRHWEDERRCCDDGELPWSSLSCFGIFVCKCWVTIVFPMHMDEYLSSVLFSEKYEMEGGQKLPYTIINDLSRDGKCSATKRNNQSALKITSKSSLLASRSPGAIPSPL